MKHSSLQRLWMVGFCVPVLSLGAFRPSQAKAAPSAKPSASRQPTEFQRHLQAAIRLYENLDYEKALEKLTRTRRHVRDPEDNALVSFYEGIVLADLNRREEARAAFRSGLLLKPEARLPLKVSPKVEQDFEAMRVDVQRGSVPPQTQETVQPTEVITQQSRDEGKLALSSPPPPDAQQAQPVDARLPILTPVIPAPGVTASPTGQSKRLAHALIGGGAVVAGAGVFLGLSGLSFNDQKREMTISEAVNARTRAGTQLSVGTVLLGAGLTALGTGTALLFLPRNGPAAVASESKTSWVLTPLPGGFALGSTGRF